MTAWLMVLLVAAPPDGALHVRVDAGVDGRRLSRAAETPTISGSLDKEVIRRVIRAHVGRVRHCFELTLTKKPDAKGKVAITFAIEKNGKVSQAAQKENTVGDEALGACVTQAVLAMTFPEPKGGGKVIVTYPFVFATAE